MPEFFITLFLIVSITFFLWISLSILGALFDFDKQMVKTVFIRVTIPILALILYSRGIWTINLMISAIIVCELAISPIQFIMRDNQGDTYHFDQSQIASFMTRNLNSLRQVLGKMPIWIVPYCSYRNSDLLCLNNAVYLWNDIKNALKQINWSKQRKQAVLKQTYLICENITKAIWKLDALSQTKRTIKEQFDKDGKNRQEIDLLSKNIRDEMQHALEVLSSFSTYLAKLRVSDVSVLSDVNRLIEQIDISSKELAEVAKVNGNNIVKTSSDYSLWSYTTVFVVVVATFTISSMYVPNYAFAITVSGSLLGLLIIGILKLRDSEKISENSFTQIVIEFLKNIRLLK